MHSSVLLRLLERISDYAKRLIEAYFWLYNMHVPDLPGLRNATETTTVSEARVIETQEATESDRKARGFSRPSALRNLSHDTSRTTPAEKEQAKGLEERASSCTRGEAFYRCANGFTGCCSHDPCNPGGSCRDGESAGSKTATPESATDAQKATSQMRTQHTSETLHETTQGGTHTQTAHSTHTGSSHVMSSVLSASPTSDSSTTSFPLSDPTAPSPPPCPAGNGTHYTDSSKIEYVILCNIGNPQKAFNTITVGTGGYSECFSSCSYTDTCAGFTFVGHDSGDCYLKNQLPNETYVAREGSNYVTCAKLDPTASSGDTGSTGGTSTAKKAGIIAGAVIGGIALLTLLLFLIAFFAKRKRKKIEKRRATITHVIQGPIENPQLGMGSHQRQGSTSHDVFQPFGGSYYPPPQHTRQRSIYRDQQWV